jgi:hypothetical protein
MTRWIAAALAALLLAGCGGDEEPEVSSKQEPETATQIDADQVLGKWNTDRDFESTIVIYEDGDDLRMLESFDDGSDLDSLLYESVENGETRYAADYGRDLGEYYVIGEDGRLQMWSDNGNYYTAPIDD